MDGAEHRVFIPLRHGFAKQMAPAILRIPRWETHGGHPFKEFSRTDADGTGDHGDTTARRSRNQPGRDAFHGAPDRSAQRGRGGTRPCRKAVAAREQSRRYPQSGVEAGGRCWSRVRSRHCAETGTPLSKNLAGVAATPSRLSSFAPLGCSMATATRPSSAEWLPSRPAAGSARGLRAPDRRVARGSLPPPVAAPIRRRSRPARRA